jgi:FMN phosphatase YigB (HAD superfamily)
VITFDADQTLVDFRSTMQTALQAVLAHDHGLRKADPGFYEDVLAVTRCDANELVHVGDSLENDVFPARAIGIRTVWLNRAGGAKSATDIPEIHSLAELPALLGFGSSDETAV